MIRLPRVITPTWALVLLPACGTSGGDDDVAGTETTVVGTSDPSASTNTGSAVTTTPMTTASTEATSLDSSGTTASESSGDESTTSTVPTEPFSFFVTSLRAMQELSDSEDGFGGDLSYGEVGPGAGLRGADAICAAIAEQSMPGAAGKQWHAFLSASAGDDGQPVNAIDRIGPGPWYDRLGRLVAMTPADLQNERPQGGDPVVDDDLPNEDGVPNHQPDPTMEEVDNHDTLTGSDGNGMLMVGATCNDWTSAVGEEGVRPRIGHSWPREGDNGRHWISEHDAGGCGPGVNINGGGGPQPGDYTVGAGGGYGGIYCFAMVP
jgi:hypothetical protein